ncbi:MAG: hypothetical protein HUU37_10475, partial [Bdellovibrionales bacterium]|nr:hypothetical protein [Bdellovibrionales bacterium]
SQMGDRSEGWSKNASHIQEEISDIEKDIEGLTSDRDAQEKKKLENQQQLNKWKQSLSAQVSTFQKLEQKYLGAVREAQRKADKR